MNWDKHNSSKKKGHHSILISTRFLNDAKVRSLTPVSRLLFLSCLLLAGESNQSEFEVTHESLVFQSGVKSESLQSQLDQMTSLQLVTYEEIQIPSRIEENRREKNRTEKNVPIVLKPKPKIENNPEVNRAAWNAYRDAYMKRWRQEPIRDSKNNSAIATIVKRVGGELAPEILKFFVGHNDGFYIKSTHALGLALKDIETLRTQFLNGKPITMGDVRKFEAKDHYRDQLARIESGEL